MTVEMCRMTHLYNIKIGPFTHFFFLPTQMCTVGLEYIQNPFIFC